MKERPIIFNTENVKAILDGRKTQTRRVIKPQPTKPIGVAHDWEWKPGGMLCYDGYFRQHAPDHCPYGQVGDTLWVRETFAYESPDGDRYVTVIPGETKIYYHATDDWEGVRVPSIFMPRWASRINLEITGIRVERLQEITEEDAKAEGVSGCFERHLHYDNRTYRCGFQRLWDSLIPKYPWESNPWVWVISFKPVKEGERWNSY